MTAGRTLSRWISLCASVLVLIQLGAMVHLATAPHGVCWEHGVVVDLDGAPVTAHALALPAAPGVGRAVRSDAHPHCPALWVTRATRTELQVSWPVAAVGDEVGRVRAPESVPAPAHRVLRNAPKHSPPV